MEIKYICTYWGRQDMPIATFVEKALNAGYDGIELNVPVDEEFTRALSEAVDQKNAILIAQMWLPPARENVEQYRARMTANLTHLVSLSPVFINSHTGKDYYSFDENCSLIETAQEFEEKTGVKILLEDQEEILERIIPAVRYLHARVGYDESAQVNHPFAPEWESTLNRFVSWWQTIIDQARDRGEEVFHICPEFGPAPYMPVLPFTGQPVADQWQINLDMMNYLKKGLVV